MRLSGAEGPTSPAPERAGRGGDFEAALGRAEAGPAPGRAPPSPAPRAPPAPRTPARPRAGEVVARRVPPGGPRPRGVGATDRDDLARPDAWPAAAPPSRSGGPAPPGAPAPPPGGAVTLSLAVRALVPAVEAFQRAGRSALSLDFGPALGVELRAEPGGVALTLAAAPGLAAAARAELPALARALAARGVAVVRAEVRPRPRGDGRGR